MTQIPNKNIEPDDVQASVASGSYWPAPEDFWFLYLVTQDELDKNPTLKLETPPENWLIWLQSIQSFL